MIVTYDERARKELDDAVDYYNGIRPGLGQELAHEVEAAIAKIVENPLAWSPLSRNTRRRRTKRFKYAIIYQVRADMILIVAVMHMSRRPGYWKKRLR